MLDAVTGEVNSLSVPFTIYRIEWDGEDTILASGELPNPWRNAVVRIPLDGSPSIELFTIPPGSGSLAWSPNRQCYALSFALAGSKNETDIFAKNGSPLTGVSGTDNAVWSPDGSKLALECGNGGPMKACVWLLDGGEPLREIGDGEPVGWSGNGDAVVARVWKQSGPSAVVLSATGEATPISVDGQSATLSPDGGHLAFIRNGNIYVKDLSSGDEVQVTDSIIPYMRQLSWSPDGSTLLFAYNPDDTDIYIANADGSGERLLMSGDSPSWSPDGFHIEFDVGECALGCWGSWYVADVTGGSVVRLGNYSFGDVVTSLCRGNTDDPWSPDGRYVLYETEGDPNVKAGIYLANPDGSSPLRTSYGSGSNWSPDGSRVTFTGSASDLQRTCTVFTAAVPDGEPVPLAEGLRATWSPRGDLIAFTVDNEIHVINPDGTGERTLTQTTTAGTPLYLLWSPDGRMLASSYADPSNRWSTYVVDVDNPGQATYVSDGEVESWTPDGQKLVVMKDEDRHRVSYIVNLDGSGEQKFVDGAGLDWSPDGSKILYSR